MESSTSTLTASPVVFPYKGGAYLFRPEQIIRLQSESNYTYIYTTDHKPILMAKVLTAYEALLLPFGFVRTHRSHLINRTHVADIQRDVIIMDDRSVAEISRRKRKQVLQSFLSFTTAA